MSAEQEISSSLEKTQIQNEQVAEVKPEGEKKSTATGGSEAFFQALENRRTYYALSNKSPISDAQIDAIVQRALKYTPSSFHMQQQRAVVVTGEHHTQLWDTIWEAQKPVLGGDKATEDMTKGRIDGFKGAYGSVVFLTDKDVLEAWGKNMPYVKDLFVNWGDVSGGMLQLVVWAALEAEGLGASLQHNVQVSPAISDAVAKLLDVPTSWNSIAVMPFGTPVGPPGNPAHPKSFEPLEKRFKSLHA